MKIQPEACNLVLVLVVEDNRIVAVVVEDRRLRQAADMADKVVVVLEAGRMAKDHNLADLGSRMPRPEVHKSPVVVVVHILLLVAYSLLGPVPSDNHRRRQAQHIPRHY